MIRLLTGFLAAFALSPALAAESFRFALIDGGKIDLGDRRGKPVLRVGTAAPCGIAGPFDALRDPHQRFGDRALILAMLE